MSSLKPHEGPLFAAVPGGKGHHMHTCEQLRTVAGGSGRLRTYAIVCKRLATFSKHALKPQNRRVKRETVVTHWGIRPAEQSLIESAIVQMYFHVLF